MVQEVGCSYWENLQQISKGEVCVGHCHDWRRLWVLSDNVLGKYSTWTSSIYLQENRNLWLLTMFYLFKLTRLQFCNYCWAIRAYSHTCNQALSFSVLADLSHMLYIEKQVHFVPVAEFAVTLLCCTLLTIIFWPCNWLCNIDAKHVTWGAHKSVFLGWNPKWKIDIPEEKFPVSVEQFNRTLKVMLRKTTTDAGKDWEFLMPYLLFAYREDPHALTGLNIHMYRQSCIYGSHVYVGIAQPIQQVNILEVTKFTKFPP